METQETTGVSGADMHRIITKMMKNMRVLGVYYIIAGAINCLSIIGAVIGIPLLISGIRLRESADNYGDWLDKEPGALFRALEKQQSFFSIQAIILLVSLVVGVVCICFAIFFSIVFARDFM